MARSYSSCLSRLEVGKWSVTDASCDLLLGCPGQEVTVVLMVRINGLQPFIIFHNLLINVVYQGYNPL